MNSPCRVFGGVVGSSVCDVDACAISDGDYAERHAADMNVRYFDAE
ncbi:hypothetical protein LuPra_01696 [Luteitalea pratensis]|uniref:Uncharacterized protein n=1 Tax=Luteitalea pratensis TaxID=1855912 RepID=A0A143PJB1_LUTPR|nr:hypothetical protein LuPra_01696 [Luteitalea pratensis]